MKKKIITLCMVLVLALSAVVMAGCNFALNVGTIKWVEKPATVYSLNDETGLKFAIEAEVDGTTTTISYPTTEYDVKVKNFTTNTVGTRTATVTYENLKLSFTYTVIDSKFAGGTGDEADPYKVSSPAQFQNMLNQTTFGYYELTNTIDFNGYALKMANNGQNATDEEAWTGVIDGNGYSLTGISQVLTPDGQAINKYNEIFGRVAYKNEKFVLKNVTVAFASTGASATMGLVTSNATDGEIEFENVKLTGYLNAANSGNSNVSPFVSFLQRTLPNKNVPALKALTLKNCSSDLQILNAYATSLVSGFVSGQSETSTGAVKFVNCSFNGLIEGAFQYGAGAFYTNNKVGTADDATFTNCTVGENAKIIKTSGLQEGANTDYNCGNVSVDTKTNHANTLEGITGSVTVDSSLTALTFTVDENLKVTATVEGAVKYEIYAIGNMQYETNGGAFRYVQPATAGEGGKLEYTLLKIKANNEGTTTNTETTYGSNLIVNEGGTLVYYCATVCKSIDMKTSQLVVVAYNDAGTAIAIGSIGSTNAKERVNLMAE